MVATRHNAAPHHCAHAGYKGSSDLFIDSNVQLSMAAAKSLAAKGRRVHVVMPDHGEYVRTYKMWVVITWGGRSYGKHCVEAL